MDSVTINIIEQIDDISISVTNQVSDVNITVLEQPNNIEISAVNTFDQVVVEVTQSVDQVQINVVEGTSGGGGDVDSVNGKTGTVVLTTGDLEEDTDHNYVTDAQKTVIENTSGENSGDQDLSGKEDVGVAQDIMDTHEANHPAPTIRDARNQIAGDYEPLKGADDNYVTDAEKVVISNTSNTNSGDQDISGIATNASDITDIENEQLTQNTAIGLNTAKETNVSTNLSEGTATETTVDVNSSDGNNATLAAASTSRSGVLTKAKFDEVEANNAHRVSTSNPHSTTLAQATAEGDTTTVDITVGDIIKVGDGTTGVNKDIEANNGDANLPKLRYNESTNKWQFSNDGSIFTDIGSGGGSSPLTTKGDIYTFTTEDARLPVGTDGYLLLSDSAETTGLKHTDTLPLNIKANAGMCFDSTQTYNSNNGLCFGDGDTYLYETSDDVLAFYAGGVFTGAMKSTPSIGGYMEGNFVGGLYVNIGGAFGDIGLNVFGGSIAVINQGTQTWVFGAGGMFSWNTTAGVYMRRLGIAAATPTYAFFDSQTSGMYYITGEVGLSYAGVAKIKIHTDKVKFTNQIVPGTETETSAASITFDMDGGNTQEVVLTNNLTTWGISNAEPGAEYTIWIIQDGSGSRTIADPTVGITDESNQSIATPLTTANDINIYKFWVSPSGIVIWSLHQTITV